MTIIAFIAIFLLVVLVHEWGHFFAARKTGMRVEEFGFGLPPRLWSWQGKKTLFSINALPIGGFVRIAGENGLETDVPKEEQMESKPWYAQSLVLVAGVLCNVVLAFLLFFSAYLAGVPIVSDTGTPTILSVSKDSPAEVAQLMVGDVVVSITDASKTIDSISTETLHDFLQKTTGPVTVQLTRKDRVITTTITPADTANGRLLGVSIEKLSVDHFSLGGAVSYAWYQTSSTAQLIFTTVRDLLVKLFSSHPSAEGVLGPIGLVKEVGSAAKIGFAYLLAFAGALSINLAVINILPFPALDGGRLIVVLLEAITRRKFSKKAASIIHGIGFLILLALMILLTIHDLRG